MALSNGYWEYATVLASVFEFIRDLAILAAALGIARWAWDWHRGTAGRRDEAAKSAMDQERWHADLRRWTDKIDARAVQLEGRLDVLVAGQQGVEARAAAKVRVHELLQSTTDPYLSFAEIEAALQRSRMAEPPAAEPGAQRADPAGGLSGEALRRVLIELVGEGVIAQLDRDRYFIASDYDVGDAERAAADAQTDRT